MESSALVIKKYGYRRPYDTTREQCGQMVEYLRMNNIVPPGQLAEC